MAIYAPGHRDKNNRLATGRSKRSVVVILSLTAMVDMFTVLVVFLLQNYQTTGEVIEISDQVRLPKALVVKEIQPANLIVVSKDKILLDKLVIATNDQFHDLPVMRIEPLYTAMVDRFRNLEEKRKKLGLQTIKNAVAQTKTDAEDSQEERDRRVTVQADKKVDFLTLRKVMYTLSDAGAGEVNFAVVKEETKKTE